MIPVVSIVGTSNSGKTTLVCQVVAELKLRGYRVATIKHSDKDFEVDREGTDTHRHGEAGAETVIISSPRKVAMIRRSEREARLEELVEELCGKADIVITEGFKRGGAPKIEVWRTGQPDETLVCAGDPTWIALVSDFPHDVEVPVLDLNWPEQTADFIENRFLAGRKKD